jgi:phosphoglycolate phosphatase-like HAD superfamily hydrolase
MKRPEPLSPAEIADLRGSSTHEVIKKLGVKKWQMPMLAFKGRRKIAAKMGRVNIFKGMPTTINQLADENYQLYILSTNSEAAIATFLKRYDLMANFVKIYAGTSISGKAKRLKLLQKKEHLTAGQCVYVGDETRDVEAAKQVGIKCVAVEWGYSTPKALKSYGPDAMAADPNQLLETIRSLYLPRPAAGQGK